MKMKLDNVHLINLAGVLLSVFAYAFGPWLGNRSALGLLIDLTRFLSGDSLPAEVSRQQTIFALLVALAMLLAGQAAAAYLALRTDRRRWFVIETALAAIALLILATLFFGFDARTGGLLATTLGCFIAGGSALTLAVGGGASPAIESPSAGAAAAADPMMAFQQKAAGKFHASCGQNKPFCLAVIGIAHFEGYATVFGEAEAAKMTDALVDVVRQMHPRGEAVSFSVGAAMVAWPGIGQAQALDFVRKISAKMRAIGFAGEMLLPGGQVELLNGMAVCPQDGSNLGQLTERALSAYADAAAGVQQAFSANPDGAGN